MYEMSATNGAKAEESGSSKHNVFEHKSTAEHQFEQLNKDVQNDNSSSAEKLLQEIGPKEWAQYNQYVQNHSTYDVYTDGHIADSTDVNRTNGQETLSVGNIMGIAGVYVPVASLTVNRG